MNVYSQESERNEAFDLLKAICTFLIILHHTGFFYGILNRGYIAVEFFFITSGFFLYGTYINKAELNTLDYFKKRAGRLYPEYWFAFIILLITEAMIRIMPYTHWYSPLLEFTMLQNVGIISEPESMNYPCWYLSVLLFGGTIIYMLLRTLSRKLFNIIAVTISLVIYLFLISQSPCIEQWGTVGCIFYLPFWRGLADMMIGIIIYQLPKPGKRTGIIVECCSGIGILFFLRKGGNFDYLTVFFIILLIWSICSKSSILRKIGKLKIVNIINKYQYGMYLNHACIIIIFTHLNIISTFNFWGALAGLFICIFLLSWIGYFITNCIRRKIQSVKQCYN